jgi:hypothetical protein
MLHYAEIRTKTWPNGGDPSTNAQLHNRALRRSQFRPHCRRTTSPVPAGHFQRTRDHGQHPVKSQKLGDLSRPLPYRCRLIWSLDTISHWHLTGLFRKASTSHRNEQRKELERGNSRPSLSTSVAFFMSRSHRGR